jgi:hypothetical protein
LVAPPRAHGRAELGKSKSRSREFSQISERNPDKMKEKLDFLLSEIEKWIAALN